MKGAIPLLNRAPVNLTAQSDSRAPCSTRGASQLKDGFSSMGRMGDGGGGNGVGCDSVGARRSE